MKRRTKNVTFVLALSLLAMGVLASIPSDGIVLVGKTLFTGTGGSDSHTQTQTNTGSGSGSGAGNGYIRSMDVCTRVWICPDGSIDLTSGREYHCRPATGWICTPSDESSCDAPKPDCLIFP